MREWWNDNAFGHGGKTTTTNKTNGIAQAVGFVVRVNNLDYASLRAKQNEKLLGEIAGAVKYLISHEADGEVDPEHVDLLFSPGSVIVEVSIKPPFNIAATSVQSKLSKKFHTHMLNRMAESIASIDGISAVRTGSISVSSIQGPTVQLYTMPSPTAEERTNMEMLNYILVAAGASVVIVALCLACRCAFCKSRTPRSKAQSQVARPGSNPNTVEGTVVDNVVMAV
jgi:hypothetical protein